LERDLALSWGELVTRPINPETSPLRFGVFWLFGFQSQKRVGALVWGGGAVLGEVVLSIAKSGRDDREATNRNQLSTSNSHHAWFGGRAKKRKKTR